MAKRVLIVDDSAAMRQMLHDLIEADSAFEVCGLAENGHHAIEIAVRLLPDLVILDFSMPVMNGLQAAPILINALPAAIVILFTLYDDPDIAAQARSAGIHAVVSKSTPHHLLPYARSLLKVAQDRGTISPRSV